MDLPDLPVAVVPHVAPVDLRTEGGEQSFPRGHSGSYPIIPAPVVLIRDNNKPTRHYDRSQRESVLIVIEVIIL
jgi:hypothetical protein